MEKMQKRPEQKKLAAVLFSLRDKDGLPTGESMRIYLTESGQADLSAVTDERIRKSWEEFGVKDEYGLDRVLPQDGNRFLKCLLRLNNQLWSFDPED